MFHNVFSVVITQCQRYTTKSSMVDTRMISYEHQENPLTGMEAKRSPLYLLVVDNYFVLHMLSGSWRSNDKFNRGPTYITYGRCLLSPVSLRVTQFLLTKIMWDHTSRLESKAWFPMFAYKRNINLFMIDWHHRRVQWCITAVCVFD